MALSTYAELLTSIANWLNRDDLTSVIPDFVVLGEARINRDLRVRAMEETEEIFTVDGTATVALPTKFIAAKRLYISGSPNKILTYMTPEQMLARFPGSDTGEPRYYTIEEANFRFGPTPGSVYTIPVLYYKRLTALSSALNSVFTNNPDVYLQAALIEAWRYLKDEKRMADALELYRQAVHATHDTDQRGSYSGSTLQIRYDGDTP